MYMIPGASVGGGLCSSQACTHFMALASMHIGSGPGVAGLSGIQVKPLLPARSIFIVPSSLATTMAAFSATAAGAADIALLIGSAWSTAVASRDGAAVGSFVLAEEHDALASAAAKPKRVLMNAAMTHSLMVM